MKGWAHSVLLFLSVPLFSLDEHPVKENHLFYGKHFTASYLECDEEAVRDNEGVRHALLEATEASQARVLGYIEYEFVPQGFTMAILLSESHATIHTYPEHRACFVDLFTCGEGCCSRGFDEVMRKYLQPKRTEINEFVRKD